MRALVTGAAGFIGLNVAEALLARGDEVVLADRAPLPERARRDFAALPGRFREVRFDVAQPDAAAGLIAEVEPTTVFHGAALTPGRGSEAARAADAVAVNVLGTVRMVEAAAPVARRFVMLSSGSVYGANARSQPQLDEAGTPPAPAEVYPVTKLAAERLATRLGELAELDVRVLRIGTAYGPWERRTDARDTPSALWQVTRLAQEGREAVLPREGRRDWIYSRDVAGAALALADVATRPSAAVNVGLGDAFSVSGWCERLSERWRGFRHRIADAGEAVNVDFYGPDRSPLSIARLTGEVGFRPAFGLDAAFRDLMGWLDREGDHG